jgi:hypothetical protein
MAPWQLRAEAATMVPFSASIFSNFGPAAIWFYLASVAICANTRRCSQPQALTMCRADLPLARSNERRKNLPINRHKTLAVLRELRHEPLKRSWELIRIEVPKQPAERFAGNCIRVESDTA